MNTLLVEKILMPKMPQELLEISSGILKKIVDLYRPWNFQIPSLVGFILSLDASSRAISLPNHS